ncbi:MAG: hypothetical protein ABI222_10870 [Opitutaceae bacterium]
MEAIRNGQNPSDPTFNSASFYPITPAMQEQIAAPTALPCSCGGNVGANGQHVNPAANEDGPAKRIDLKLNRNSQLRLNA